VRQRHCGRAPQPLEGPLKERRRGRLRARRRFG
jgi:hypothetical protein